MCVAAGRILIHGFFLTGYLPLTLDPCITFHLLTGRKPSNQALTKGYLKSLGEVAEDAISSLRSVDTNYDAAQRLLLLSHLHGESITESPRNKEELEVLLQQLGQYNLFIKPHFILHNIGRSSSNNFTRNVGDDDWQKYLIGLLPTGDIIAETLTPMYGADTILHQLEQSIFDHVERYVREMSPSKAQLFLRFVTGCEVSQPVIVIFNSEESEHGMLPKAHTCSCELELSRFTPDYDWLSTTMDNILSGSHTRSGFQFA